MIVGIEGHITTKELTHVDVQTASGLIYRVYISLNTHAALHDKHVTLHTSHIIREDSHTLYGFSDPTERVMFEMLLKVNGVGPKVATAICSTFTPQTFAQIVQSGDANALTKVPGIGKKSAGVILVQLGAFSSDLLQGRASPTTRARQDAVLALESLGFKREQIDKVLATCQADDTGELVKEALKKMQR